MMQDQKDRLRCGFGLLGVCCLNCQLGPCRIHPFGGGDQRGDCGRLPETIVTANILGRLAAGSAVTANYARRISLELSSAGRGRGGISSKDVSRIARRLGIRGADRRRKIANRALQDFSRQKPAPLNWLKPNLARERLRLLSRRDMVPYNIDVAISEALEAEGDLEALLPRGVRCSLAHLNALHIATDLAAILGKDPLAEWCFRREVGGDTKHATRKAQETGVIKPHVVLDKRLRELLAESMLGGELAGVAIFLGCAGLSCEEASMAGELASRNVLSLFAGCAGDSLERVEYSRAGRSLRSVLERMGRGYGSGEPLPALVNVGPCTEVLKALELARDFSDRHGDDGRSAPLLGVVTDKADNKIEVMAHGMMALGIPVYWARIPPLLGSPKVAEVYGQTFKTLLGGYAVWEKDGQELAEMMGRRSPVDRRL